MGSIEWHGNLDKLFANNIHDVLFQRDITCDNPQNIDWSSHLRGIWVTSIVIMELADETIEI